MSTPPPRDPDADETVVVDRAARREEVVEEEVVPPRRPPRLWPWLLALLLLVLGGLAAYWFVARDDEKTTMPRVVGLTEAQARARIAEAELEADVDRRPSNRRAGIVFAQVPGAGVQLDEGERVEIKVSSARLRVPVPNVIDLKEAEALERLRTAKFEPKVQRVFAGAPKGVVVDTDPRGGERAVPGSTVLVKVSKGRNLNTVPDVVGMTEEEAGRALRRREFEVRIFDVPAPDPRGTVIAQEPEAGEQAPPDSRVRINVSTGEESGETTERPATGDTTTGAGSATVRVPNVVGLAQTPALRRLRAAGLRGIVAYRTSDQPRGRVIEQRPAQGGTARRNARVQLVVSAGSGSAEAIEVPDVRGLDETEATQSLEDAGFRVEIIRTGDGTTVEDQQPAPGVTSSRGAVVTLFVG